MLAYVVQAQVVSRYVDGGERSYFSDTRIVYAHDELEAAAKYQAYWSSRVDTNVKYYVVESIISEPVL